MTFENAAEMKAALERRESVSYEDIKAWQRHEQQQRLVSAVHRAGEGETDWKALSYEMGRNELPDLLVSVWHRLSGEQLVKAVSDAWVTCEFPELALPRRKWLPIFRAAGYHAEDRAATPPKSITLWRGGVRRTRMAWTADRELAEWFQHRFDHTTPGKLWTVTVGADRLLAHYHQEHRSENEYVIDPTGIRPKEVQ